LGGNGAPPSATADEQACLADALADGLAVSHPGFGNGRDPALVRGLLRGIVFDRGATPPAADPTAPVPDSAAPTSPLDQRLADLRSVLPHTTVSTTTSTLPTASSTTLTGGQVLGNGPVATGLTTTHTGATYSPSLDLGSLLPPLPSVPDLLALLGSILQSTLYRLCAESATQPLKCSLPQPIATPILMDVDGNGLPDVTGTLLPNLGPNGGAQLQLNVTSLVSAKPAHVFALFTLPGTYRQFAVGFDGRGSRLGDSQTVTFILNSILRAVQGDIDTTMKLEYSNPGPTAALTVDVATINSSNILGTNPTLTDPIHASIGFNPTPTKFTVDARLQNTSTPEVTVRVRSTVPTVLTAHADIASTAAHTLTAVDAQVTKLPTDLTVDVKNNGSNIVADYNANAKIDDLKLSARSVPDTSDLTTYSLLSADATQIPATMHLVVTKPYDAVLSTGSPIGASQVSLQSVRGGVVHSEIFGSVDQVPANVHLHGDVNGAGDDFTAAFQYTADSSIPNVHFRLFDDQDLHAFVDTTAQQLPKYLQVSVAKHPHDSEASFDARTAPGDAPGSSSVGPITLKYTSTGTQLADADLPSTDYVVMKETAADVQAALKYTGLALVHYALHDDVTAADHDTVSAELRNAQSRKLTLVGDTPALSVNSVVDSLPADMTLDYAKVGTETDLHYHASSTIDSITAAVTEKAGAQASVGAFITGVPDDIVLKADQVAGQVDWTASSTVASLGFSGQADALGHHWVGGATLSSVPKHWHLSFAPNQYAFTAGTDTQPETLGLLAASLTNTGTVPTESGNHALADYDVASGDLDASFTMSAVHSFSYTPDASGFVAHAELGGHQPFHLKGTVQLPDANPASTHADRIAADVTISPLPTSMTFTQHGQVLDYTSDTSPDIDASVEIGRTDAVAVTPAPPVVRGVSLRDGRACDAGGCATGLKGHLFLQGFPSELHADLSKVDYSITHYAPPAAHNEFDADVALVSDPDPGKHITATLSLGGIDPTGTNMEIGPITTTPGPVEKSETTTVKYTGNHAVGPLDASVVYGDKTARVTVSNVPATMTFAATTRPDGIVVTGDLQDPIDLIQAFYKPTGAANWALTGSLAQIPRHFSFSQLTIGDQPSSDPCAPPPPKPPVPTVDYTASNDDGNPVTVDPPADTLDITAAVDLGQLSGSLSGRVTAGITNLGHETHASWDGTDLVLDSTPRTDSFEVHVPNAQVKINLDFDTSAPDPCNPSSGHDFISISANGHVYVTVDIADAGMTLTDVHHIDLKPGFSSGITGDFGSFGLGWGGLHVSIDAAVNVDLDIDFGGGIEVSPTLASLAAVIQTDVHVDFGIYSQEQNRILHIFPIVPVPCSVVPPGVYFIDVFLTPKRIATGHDGFEVDGTPGSTTQFVVTANPFGIIPDVVLDGVTGLFTSPFDKGLDAGFNCSA
ncbi:MAG: hypothetical protein ACTHMS_07750, partial [Jatrophihabitans sp.]|uniref:hypothetical protein n=1 Tax=Jatrophihabitans sp. TaxID=1932789 RepID=UPI003F7D1DF9